MLNETCQVMVGNGKCNREAVAVLKQTIRGTSAVAEKTITTPVCAKHAQVMRKTTGPHTIEPYQRGSV